MKQSSLQITAFLILLIVFQFVIIVSYGQTKGYYAVSGYLIDSISKQPVEYGSVALYTLPDTNIVTGTTTNENGSFTIRNVSAGKFLLKFSFVGYKVKMTSIEIINSSVILSKPVQLVISSISLNEIQITESKNEKQISIEKTKINLAQNISGVTGNIAEVLKSQPSINIDNENNIYIRGNVNILILLDGIPTTVTSLQSMPASGIESIEIITNPDSKFDAEGTGGIINILTKKQTLSGFSGAASLNYAYNNRLNGGLNFNYSKKIWNIGFNYNGKYEESEIKSELTRQLYSQTLTVEQKIFSEQLNNTHLAGIQFSVIPDKKNIFYFNVRVMSPGFFNLQNISGRQINDTLPEILFNRKNDITFSRKNIETTFSYKKIFEKNKNEISFDASFSRTKGSRPARYYEEEILIQKSEGGGAPTNITLQFDYLKSVFKTGIAECGLKGFSRWNNFNYYFFNLDTISEQWYANEAYSNDLQHQEYIYSAYLMYSDTLLNKLYYKIGMRSEYNSSEFLQISLNDRIFREYLYPFPYVLIKRTISQSQNIAFSLNRRITRPTYPQLNPFINVIDQMTYETGNKYLEPEVSDKAELNYSLVCERFQFRTNIFHSSAKDYITQVSTLSGTDKLIVTYINGNRQNKTGSDIDFSYKFNKLISVNPSFSVFYTRSNGNYNEIDLSTDKIAWTGNLKLMVKPEKKTEIQILLSYNSPIELPQFDLNEIYYTDVSIKHAFCENKLSVSLMLSDLFNTRRWEINSDNPVYRLYNLNKIESRILWIGMTYNFNSFKLIKTQKTDNLELDNNIIKLGQ